MQTKTTDNSPLFLENSPAHFFLLTQNESMMNDLGNSLIIDYPVKPKNKKRKTKPVSVIILNKNAQKLYSIGS